MPRHVPNDRRHKTDHEDGRYKGYISIEQAYTTMKRQSYINLRKNEHRESNTKYSYQIHKE